MIQPDNTSSLILAVLSSDSPVKADVSNEVLPRVTTPSTGILSPFFMTKISPTSMSSTSIFFVLLWNHKQHRNVLQIVYCTKLPYHIIKVRNEEVVHGIHTWTA